MTGIRDIACKAGVSVATVSRVINRTGHVGGVTRARVQAAVAELGYTPNPGARLMRRGDSRMVGLLLPALDVPFFGILAHTIEKELVRLGYHALICCTDESVDQEGQFITTLLEHKVSGVLAASVLSDVAHFRRLEAAGIPIVAIDREIVGIRAVTVRADHHLGGRMMADHLLSLGHRRIGIVGGPDHSTPVRARVEGARERMAEAGLEPVAIRLGALHDFDLFQALAKKVLSGPDRPTAMIGTTDIAAIGVLHAAAASGLSVPRDLSIIGFDDMPAARYVLPELTTVAQPMRAIGALAVAQLAALMTGQEAVSFDSGVLPLRLIVRGTTVAPQSGVTEIG